MTKFFTVGTVVTDELLRVLAHLPTSSFASLVDAEFWQSWSDADFMRIAVHLAQKSYDEGGCPIGGVIVDNLSRCIVGKGHNTLVQNNDPYNHGETAAMRDAGSIDFSQTTMFTTLTPCIICTHLILERGFRRLLIGNSPNADHNEALLASRGVEVVRQFDPVGIALYAQFQTEQPQLDLIDWRGIAGAKQAVRA